MASSEKGNPPAPLKPQVVKKLLYLLSTNDDFRELFATDAHAALVKAGYVAPAGSDPRSSLTDASAQSGGNCLQLKVTDTLASKEQIIRDQAKLESDLLSLFHFDCPNNFKAD